MNPDRSVSRREIEDSTAARLAEIVAAAEGAAKRVLDETEAAARERLADAEAEVERIVAARLARLSGLANEIGARADDLARQADALGTALAGAKTEPAGAAAVEDPAPGGAAPPGADRQTAERAGPALTVVGGQGGATTADTAGPSAADPAAGARLLATQMAVSGAGRAEIEARLRDGFAPVDPVAILDAILGPER